MNIDFINQAFADALNSIGATEGFNLFFEEPKNSEHGDLSTNVAMQLAKKLQMPPRKIAELILEKISFDVNLVEKADIAGAGFINIKFKNHFYHKALDDAFRIGDDYGRNQSGKGKKVNVEYVSANPTGMLHMGHGRNACIGDTVANLFDWNGWDVTREYYFNNAGNQMNNLGKSIYARYMQKVQSEDFPFPEDGYHGAYIIDIAEELIELHGTELLSGDADALQTCRVFGEKWCFDKIIQTMKSLNVHHDVYFNESDLYTDGKVEDVISLLKSKNLAYDKDGAVWIALTKMGLNDDRVIVKSSGEPTYRLPDIAYHIEKYNRGYDIIVDVFGADHIATIPDVIAALNSLGYAPDKMKVLIHQFVTLTENGQQVKMSKRSGKSYTLDELIQEVGSDVVRFFFIMRGISTHLEFDLALAREQSDKNPVFYLQYAHARICSVIDKAKESDIQVSNEFDSSLLKEKQELNLIKTLLNFPDIVKASGEKCEPQILSEYLRDLAACFHIFYHDCRVIGVDEGLQNARLNLCRLTKTALNNGLAILGISAPVRM